MYMDENSHAEATWGLHTSGRLGTSAFCLACHSRPAGCATRAALHCGTWAHAEGLLQSMPEPRPTYVYKLAATL